MRNFGVVLAGVFLLAFSPLVMIWGLENERVDRCQNQGGSFDYEAMQCDANGGASHPFIPFSSRHPYLVVLAEAGAGAIVVAVLVTYRKASVAAAGA